MTRLFPVCLVLLSLVSTAVAQEAPSPPQLTWVRYYQVQPGKSGEFMRLMNDAAKPLFQRLIADKTVANWGVVVPMTHNEETWTHAVFVTMPDWSAVGTMVSAVEKSDRERAKKHVSAKAVGTAAVGLLLSSVGAGDFKGLEDPQKNLLVPGTIHDVVLRHVAIAPAWPSSKPNYLAIDTYVVKPGRESDALGLYRQWAVPSLTSLAADGKVGAWGFSMQDVATTPDWTHMAWMFLSDLAGIDSMFATNMALPPATRAEYAVRLRDLSEPDKHRGQLLRVLFSAP